MRLGGNKIGKEIIIPVKFNIVLFCKIRVESCTPRILSSGT
jgi:hypothetical protein